MLNLVLDLVRTKASAGATTSLPLPEMGIPTTNLGFRVNLLPRPHQPSTPRESIDLRHSVRSFYFDHTFYVYTFYFKVCVTIRLVSPRVLLPSSTKSDLATNIKSMQNRFCFCSWRHTVTQSRDRVCIKTAWRVGSMASSLPDIWNRVQVWNTGAMMIVSKGQVSRCTRHCFE